MKSVTAAAADGKSESHLKSEKENSGHASCCPPWKDHPTRKAPPLLAAAGDADDNDGACDGVDGGLSEYTCLLLRRIHQNKVRLEALGLLARTATGPLVAGGDGKRSLPRRRSAAFRR